MRREAQSDRLDRPAESEAKDGFYMLPTHSTERSSTAAIPVSSEQSSAEFSRKSLFGPGFTEVVGTLIDALYGVALPLIAVELPMRLNDSDETKEFLYLLVGYALSFSILFSCWIMQRRINGLITDHTRATLWLTGVTLMFACLLPVATALVFRHGDIVNVLDLRYSILVSGEWTKAEVVDLFFLLVVVALAGGSLLIAHLVHASAPGKEAELCYRRHLTRFTLVIGIGMMFLLLPVQNRYACFVLPVCLFLDEEIDVSLQWLFKRRAKPPTSGKSV